MPESDGARKRMMRLFPEFCELMLPFDHVQAKIADLTRIERVLSETVAQCTGDAAPECAVIDALLEA